MDQQQQQQPPPPPTIPSPYYNEHPVLGTDAAMFDNYFNRYEISYPYRTDLLTLSQFDIVLILDDSGSMDTRVQPGGPNTTRWTELINMTYPIIELGALLDTDGIDVIFMNRGTRYGVRSRQDLDDLLLNRPTGCTPLSAKTREAMALYKGKPQLLIIMTDGQPSGSFGNGGDSVQQFQRVLEHERHVSCFVSILKCSDREDETGYLDDLDRELPNLNVIDDYASERAQVLQYMGPSYTYTPGDNIARLLLGAIYAKYDTLDGF